MKLDPHAAEVTGRTAELNEDGFKEVLLKEDAREMEDFMRRVGQDIEPKKHRKPCETARKRYGEA